MKRSPLRCGLIDRVGFQTGHDAILLPETDLAQAKIVADRLCGRTSEQTLMAHRVHFKVTASIGIATASVSMSGFDVLMRSADQAPASFGTIA